MTVESGDQAEIERVARALCIDDGYDPDLLVAPGPVQQGPRGTYFMPPPARQTPIWNYYVRYAKAAIGVIRNKSKIELVSADRPVPYVDWIRDVKSYAYDLLKPGASRESLDEAIVGLRHCLAECVE